MRKELTRLIEAIFCLFFGLTFLTIVSCGDGGSSTPTVNNAPVAFAGANQKVTIGSTVTLDGTGSYDDDGDTLTYSWAFTQVPAGNTSVLSDSTAAKPTFAPNVTGDYVARLIVSDGKAEKGNAAETERPEKASPASYVTITSYSTTPPVVEGDNQLWKLESVGDGYYRIVAKHSNKVLDVEGRSIALGAQVNQYTYNGGDHQKFYFSDYSYTKGTGVYEIRVKHTGPSVYYYYSTFCIDVENGSLADHAKVQQQLCSNGQSNSKLWYVIDNGNGYYKIKNYKSGKCMDVTGASLADKANVQQFTCY